LAPYSAKQFAQIGLIDMWFVLENGLAAGQQSHLYNGDCNLEGLGLTSTDWDIPIIAGQHLLRTLDVGLLSKRLVVGDRLLPEDLEDPIFIH
jgi:hypothetical protein